jgi:negative regulator of flagellin synthesis FlgM
MKIENSTKPANVQSAKETRVQSARKSDSTATDVQLSSLSAQLRTTENAAPFDAARVSEIKQAIAEGRFTINTGAIADRLIESARELVASR